MKIGLISFHSFDNPGGVKSHILGLAKEFRKRGNETKIIVPRRRLFEKYDKDTIILGTSIPFSIAGTQGDICLNFTPFAIKKMLAKENFDVLHFHNFIIPSALQILKKSDCTNVMTFHANLEAMPLIERKKINSLFVKELNKKMAGIIGVASFNLDPFKEFNGLKTVIPNGIDLDVFNPKVQKIEKFNDGMINILFLGRIEERKGLIYLLMAYKLLQEKYNNLRLIIVGDGPLEKECREYEEKNGLKNVSWEGRQTGSAAARYYASCDIYCSPAIFGESFGIVLLEAMACGKPICGFRNGGYGELLKGTIGDDYLAEPKDYIGLAQKLENLISDKGKRRQMTEWGIAESSKYSWKNVADKVLNFYEQCRDFDTKNIK